LVVDRERSTQLQCSPAVRRAPRFERAPTDRFFAAVNDPHRGASHLNDVCCIAPVFVGDLVSFYAETVKIGNTSITIRVTVDANRGRDPHEAVRVTQAEVVYVAIDEPGRPVPVASAS